MTDSVIETGYVYLNSVKYPIDGFIFPQMQNRFPPKLITGDYAYNNEQFLSALIIKDHRGGILVEEIDERVHVDRSWWSTCLLGYDGHLTLPRLTTAITTFNALTGGFKDPTSAVDPDTEWTDEDKTFNGNTGDYGFDDIPLNSWGSFIELYIAPTYCKELRIWPDGEVTGAGQINNMDIDILVDGVWTGVTEAEPTWGEYNTFAISPSKLITGARIRLYNDFDSAPREGRIHDFDFGQDDTAPSGTIGKAVEYNSESYRIIGSYLTKLKSGRAAYDAVQGFHNTPTALVVGPNQKLYILTGDTSNYFIMDTSEAWTEAASDLVNLTADASTNSVQIVDAALSGKFIVRGDYVFNTTRSAGAIVTSYTDGTTTIALESAIANQASGDSYSVVRGGTRGIMWSNRLYKLKDDGTFDYSADPDDATPTWIEGGKITDIPDLVETLYIDKDASGNKVIYCATNSILFAYDDTNSIWLETEVILPNHPNGGKGAAVWRDGAHISSGLDVRKYIPGAVATLSEIGLNRDGGLPVEYNGEIVKLYGEGENDMFALVDASQTSGNSKSTLMAWDGRGWSVWWADTNNNGVMHDVIVSSAESGYAIYWDAGGAIYYIDLHRGIRNPTKVTAQSFGDTKNHFTGWYDFGSAVSIKRAEKITLFTEGITANETVVVKYRINHTNTDLDTGWTTLGTINDSTIDANGIWSTTFGSSLGLLFLSIQFRFDLERGSTATLTPDILAATFNYAKLTDARWSWSFIVICNDDAEGTALEKESNLITAAESNLKVPMVFREDSTDIHYVTVTQARANNDTGDSFRGRWTVTVLEPL